MPDWILEDDKLRVIISAHGGGVRLTSIYQKEYDKEWIRWKQQPLFGSGEAGEFDQQYCGGCEFLFPNDLPISGSGLELQDHGYLWTTLFKSKGIENEKHRLKLELEGYISCMETEVRISFSLEKGKGELSLQAELISRKKERQPYLFRFHPSFIVTEKSRLRCYGTKVEFEEDGSGIGFCSVQPLEKTSYYPFIKTTEGILELERLPETNLKEFFCHIEQEKGRFLLEDEKGQIIVSYPKKQFPYLTFYYMNQEGEKTWIAEPSTSNRMDISKLIEEKTVSWLEFGVRKQWELKIKAV